MNGFAKPRFALPADSFASAVIPAISGAAALVPPTMFQTRDRAAAEAVARDDVARLRRGVQAMSGVTRHWAVPLAQNPPGTSGVRPPRW